jgi:hypothetical protein
MRGPWTIATGLPLVLVTVLALTGVHTAAPTVAAFDRELIDTSLEGATYGPHADQAARLASLGSALPDRLAKSGRVDVVDIAPVAAQTHTANLQACDAQFAHEVGARFSVTGTVQKVSNLILNVTLAVRDADSGRLISAKSVDMRGNTDESRSRALDWLVRFYLLAPSGQGVF